LARGAEARQAELVALAELLRAEIGGFDRDRPAMAEPNEQDLSLVTFDEMESKVMLGNVCQAIDHDNAEVLSGLNSRLARLLERVEPDAGIKPVSAGLVFASDLCRLVQIRHGA